MNIVIFLSLFCISTGCSQNAGGTISGLRIPASDSSFMDTEIMTPAWYQIHDRVYLPFRIEAGYYTFDVDKRFNTRGHTITFPQDSVPEGGVKLLAVPYENVPLDQYSNYEKSGIIRVILMNESTDTIHVRPQDGSLIMIQEAIDTDGLWKPIEYWQYSFCGNSYMSSEDLVPGYFITVNAPHFKGSFNTQVRFKFKGFDRLNNKDAVLYSNSFEGSVNPGQFQKPPNRFLRDFLN